MRWLSDYANRAEVGAIAGAMLIPIVMLAQNKAAKMLVNVVTVSVIMISFFKFCKAPDGDICYFA